ncbi:unnamed protein product, partial [Laminaria digitata]
TSFHHFAHSAFLFPAWRCECIPAIQRAAAAAAVVVVVVVSLTRRQNRVRGLRTGSHSSGVEEYLRKKTWPPLLLPVLFQVLASGATDPAHNDSVLFGLIEQ